MASSRRSIASRRSRPVRESAARRRGRTGRGGSRGGGSWLAYAAAVGAGALGIMVASALGAGELMAGGVLGYMAYRMTQNRVTPARALMEGVQFGQGQPPVHA